MPDLKSFLWPKSIAVLGASANPRKLGARILTTLQHRRFPGAIYPVNRNETEIAGLRAWPSISAIPDPVDSVFIVVPAEGVPGALRESHDAGITNAVVISSGFAEAGNETLQADLTDFARTSGMNVSGPNSEGFYNSRARLAGTFSPTVLHGPDEDRPRIRNIAVLAQSGGLAYALFSHAMRRRLGVNYVLSVGNEACLDSLDFIDWLVDEKETEIFMVFLETFRDEAKFRRVAMRAAEAGKPIIVAKVGYTEAAARAARHHTASNTGDPAAFERAFEETGVIVVDDQDAFSDVAAAFTEYPLPEGNRIAIVTASGGTGVWLTDRFERAGLTVPPLSNGLEARIGALFPAYGSARNPVDVTAQSARTDAMFRAIEALDGSGDVDAIVISAPVSSDTFLAEFGEELRRARHEAGIPVFFFSYARPNAWCMEFLGDLGIYCHTTLDGITRALTAATEYAAFQRALRG